MLGRFLRSRGIQPIQGLGDRRNALRCGTCDLARMLDGWHCPQTWHTETSGSSDDDLSMHSWSSVLGRNEDELLEGTSSLGEATVLSSSDSDDDAS